MPFCVVLACDPYANGRALLKEVSLCPTILSGAPALLDHILAAGVISLMTGYLIHSHRCISTEPTHRFWDMQAQVVTQLWIIRALTMVVAFVHPDHDCHAIGINFTQHLRSDGWVLSNTKILFPSFEDSVSGSCWLIVAIHSNAGTDCRAFEIKTPPQIKPKPIARYIWGAIQQARTCNFLFKGGYILLTTKPSMITVFNPSVHPPPRMPSTRQATRVLGYSTTFTATTITRQTGWFCRPQ